MIDALLAQAPLFAELHTASAVVPSALKVKTHHLARNTKDVLGEFSNDLKDMSLLGKLATLTAVTGIVYEWGPFNEALIGYTSASTLEGTQSAVSAGLVGGTISGAGQIIISSSLAVSVSESNRILERVRNLNKKSDSEDAVADADDKKMSLLKKFSLAFALGASALVLTETIRDPENKQARFKIAREGSALVGIGSFALVTTIAKATEFGERVASGSQEAIINIAKNGFTYLGLFGLAVVASKAKQSLKRKNKTKSQNQEE